MACARIWQALRGEGTSTCLVSLTMDEPSHKGSFLLGTLAAVSSRADSSGLGVQDIGRVVERDGIQGAGWRAEISRVRAQGHGITRAR